MEQHVEKILDAKENVLRRASCVLSSIIRGLDEVDDETKQRIMELCGEACAREDGDLEIAEKIAKETDDEKEILNRVNEEISWCGTWIQKGNTIQSTCSACGCPLVRNHIVDSSEAFCYCSRGWVNLIFTTALKRPVSVELKESIGRGDQVCTFIVSIGEHNKSIADSAVG